MTEREKLMLYIASIKMQETGVYTFKTWPAEHGTVSGYFAIYNTNDSDGIKLSKGCFSESIAERAKTGHPYALCYNNDTEQIIGAVTSIEDRKAGLFMTAKYINTPRAQEIRQLVKKGILYQLSFLFQTQESEEVRNWDGSRTKNLKKGNLYAVCIVPMAAQELALITSEKANYSKQKKELLQRIKDMEKEDMLKSIEDMKRADMLQSIEKMKLADIRKSFFIGNY